MCELLIKRTARGTGPMSWQPGHVVAVCDDGWKWSKTELSDSETSPFQVLKLPGVPTADLKRYEGPLYNAGDLVSGDPEVRANPRMEGRKRYKIDLTKLTQDVIDDVGDTGIEEKTRQEVMKTVTYDEALEKYERTEPVVIS